MRRFRYRLERFLLIRRHRERELEYRVAEAQGICLTTERSIERARLNIAGSFGFRSQDAAGVDLEGLRSSELYRVRMGQRIDSLGAELVLQRGRLADVRKEYVVASRDRKVLEKLKERRAQEFAVDQKREEQKTLDEVATSMRYVAAQEGRE